MKKSSILFASMIIAATTCFAEGSVPVTPEAIKARAEALATEAAAAKSEKPKRTRAEMEARPEVQKKTGGFLDVAPKGVSVLVIDSRAKPGDAPNQFHKVFTDLSKTNVKIEQLKRDNNQPIEAQVNPIIAKVRPIYTLVIDENPSREGLTVLPESRVALINANKYKGGDDPLAPETRLIKELWRGLGFVAGLGYAPFKNDVFQPVYSVKELDALEFQVMQPMNFQRMYQQFQLFGVTRARHIPYRLAVKEGWAPSPTNDYQKAIWEEIKGEKERGPVKGIAIPPPAAK